MAFGAGVGAFAGWSVDRPVGTSALTVALVTTLVSPFGARVGLHAVRERAEALLIAVTAGVMLAVGVYQGFESGRFEFVRLVAMPFLFGGIVALFASVAKRLGATATSG